MHYTTSCNTQSSVPEDGRNHRPKHVELIGIINKTLLLHLVGYLYNFFNILIKYDRQGFLASVGSDAVGLIEPKKSRVIHKISV